MKEGRRYDGSEIAVVGMACRFPGADDPEEFWRNLRGGVESIDRLSEEELLGAGVAPEELRSPGYVAAAAAPDHVEEFDAAFFGYNAAEARIMDPQQRVFLECCWEALEDTGCDPTTYPGLIGVFAGSKTNTYLFHLASNRELLQSMDFLQLVLGGDQAMLATRAAYKLGLKGPSFSVQSACSSSLLGVHLACQSLLLDECRMALAGGVAIHVPHRVGYRYQEGGILSPDGHCRPFDARAQGTVFGSGAGVVALKRLEDALADGDRVLALIRGSAVNNDGSEKASFTAPSVEGQAQVLLEALASSGVASDEISYVETHGTGTPLGDPIEVLALQQIFRAGNPEPRERSCALGSVKSNLGHLDAAAGVASLIKTVLALDREELPPTLHYESPNPEIDLASGPFYVNDRLTRWPRCDRPRRAGVSSFGFGGTNVHMILEEAPPREAPGASRPAQLLCLSARTEEALASAAARLADRLEAEPELSLADAAYTLHVGRRAFQHRGFVVASTHAEAVEALRTEMTDGVAETDDRRLAFLFPGQGAQYPGMGQGLYETEAVFAREVDRMAGLLEPHLGLDLRRHLFPADEDRDRAARELERTALTQPAIFTVEYALARLLGSWGLAPREMMGHSIGEYVAATLAGVFALEDALALVAERGRLMQELPPGRMLAVTLPEEEVAPLLEPRLSLAAVNAPGHCVVSGDPEAVAQLEERLAGDGVRVRALHTSHAFHSPMVEPVVERFAERVDRVARSAPSVPFVSNVTGTWITDEEAVDPAYWARHLRRPVRFADGVAELARRDRTFLEVGPGTTLSTLVRRHPAARGATSVSTLRHPNDRRSDLSVLLQALGRLWVCGVRPEWPRFYGGEHRARVSLPTYPFQRRRHWIDLAPVSASKPRLSVDREEDLARWFYRPEWVSTEPLAAADEGVAGRLWLLLADLDPLAEAVASTLESLGGEVVWAVEGEAFGRREGGGFTLRPDRTEDHHELLVALDREGREPAGVIHLWCAGASGPAQTRGRPGEWRRGFHGLLALFQALGRRDADGETRVLVISGRAATVTGDEDPIPERAALSGPVRVAPKELPGLWCRGVDLDGAPATAPELEWLARRLVAELGAEDSEPVVAYRGRNRWVERFARVDVAPRDEGDLPLTQGACCLITGGLGGLGFALAKELAGRPGARLALVGRTELPPRGEWEAHSGDSGPVADRIRKVEELERLGAEVAVYAADVADAARMAEVVDDVRERFGTLEGVVHAAGVAGGGLIQLKTPEAARQVLRPKVEGVQALESALEGERPGWLMLFSSLQAVMGDFGQADYAAANAYLDAWAESARLRGWNVLAVDWDNWREVGIAAETELPPHLEPWREELLEKAISTQEGLEVFRRVLGRPEARLVVSAQDLEERLELARTFTGGSILSELGSPGGAGAPAAGTAGGGAPPRPAGSAKELERSILGVWGRVLEVEEIGLHDNFFDLGGNSLTGMQVVSELSRELGVELAPVQLFEAPTPGAMLALLRPAEPPEPAAAAPRTSPRAEGGDDLAIIGMAGRFPGAASVDELWSNLLSGVESIRFFSDEELTEAGVPAEDLARPDYVKACPVLDGADLFDAELFGYSPHEARIMDPQHRVFLEVAWEALEDAGQDPLRTSGRVGVFAGSSISSYLRNLYSNPEVMREVGDFQALLGNEKDSLTTRVSYKLNLRGPSLAVQTFCSTSLVAVHLACRHLLGGECDVALAGGVSIHFPQDRGYVYDPSGGVSKDGHLRAFDAAASGYVFGNGAGVVVLKRLRDALEDGDPVRAVIKGTAVNNDGALKVGYTATAVEGQAEVAAEALKAAGVTPESIGYVEAHGSATPLGDPVEIHALTRAFGPAAPDRGTCPIGSIKTNVGHLDRASGVAGLIKAVLALEREEIPPSLHFETPNPAIDFASSPFRVATDRLAWERGEEPRRAAVNSLGLGGTNAHVVLEEAPLPEPSGEASPWQLLNLSAKSPEALEELSRRIAHHVRHRVEGDRDLADVAYTLHVGRSGLESRRVVICRGGEDAVRCLEGETPRRSFAAEHRGGRQPAVAFLFPGLGSHYRGMGAGLYRGEAVFRREVDRCAEILEPLLGTDVREVLAAPGTDGAQAGAGGVDLRRMLGRGPEDPGDPDPLAETRLAQPALFVVEYALARLWVSWGVEPDAMLGYSVGEYVAACLAGVLTLEESLRLVARRAALIQESPPGAMLGISAPEAEVRELLGDRLSLAAVNGPSQSVVAGPEDEVAALESALAGGELACRRLQTTHAFHSRMLEPLREAVRELACELSPREPRIPYLSNVTGTWITAEEVQDPSYWAEHMCRPVLFAPAVEELLREPDRVFLEVGPGQTLGSLVHQGAGGRSAEPRTVPSLRHAYERDDDVPYLLTALGKLWLLGAPVDWRAFHAGERRRRVRLPGYPFRRRRHWVDASAPAPAAIASASPAAAPGLRFHLPTWRRSLPWERAGQGEPALAGRRCLVFAEPSGFADRVADRLAEAGCAVTRVRPGSGFRDLAEAELAVGPSSVPDHRRLVSTLEGGPALVLHGWGTGRNGAGDQAFTSLMALAEALAAEESPEVAVWTLIEGVYGVSGLEELRPERAAALAPVQVFPLLVPGVACRAVDVGASEGGDAERLARQVLAEIAAPRDEQVVAYRGSHRWVPVLAGSGDGVELPAYERSGGAYLAVGLGDRAWPYVRRLAELPGARVTVIPEAEGAALPRGRLEELKALAEELLVVEGSGGSAAGAVARSRERFGALRGVVYAGPEASAGTDPADRVAAVLRRLEELDRALADEDLDFALLVSSLAGAGDPRELAARFAVNLTFDTFAQGRDERCVRTWTSASWDLSEEDGDGGRTFRHLLALSRSVPQVLVSSRDLGRQWNRLSRVTGGDRTLPPEERHPRPRLAVEYVAPRTEKERVIAEIWQELLGLERVGVHDSFLDLGGDSLLASRLATRLRTALRVEIPVQRLFEASTVEELAQAVEALQAERLREDASELLAKLQALSPEEVRRELEKREKVGVS